MRYKLSDIVDVIGGGTPKTSAVDYWGGDIPWLSVRDFSNDLRYVYKTEKYITKLGLENSSTKLLCKGDVIISARGTVGEIASIPYPMAFNQSCYGLRAKEKVVTEDFLYYLIRYNISTLKNQTHGSVFDTITRDTFGGIEVDIPNLIVQQKISRILSVLDEKIEINHKINKNLEAQIKTLCIAWLSDYVPFDGVCPSDWIEIPLSNIAEFISGYSYKGNELIKSQIAMATIKNFDRKGGFKLDGYKEIVPSAKLKETQYVELFDTLVAHTALTQNAEVIGNAEPIMSKSDYNDIIFSMDLVKVLPKNNNISKFLLAAILQDRKFKTHCFSYINGTTVLHLSKKALPEYRLFLPKDLSLLNPLNSIVSVLYKQISSNIAENICLERIRNSLLPKLMSGELDVSALDI